MQKLIFYHTVNPSRTEVILKSHTKNKNTPNSTVHIIRVPKEIKIFQLKNPLQPNQNVNIR